MSIDRLTIVYKADHGVVGDLVYVFNKITARDSCSLCEITLPW